MKLNGCIDEVQYQFDDHAHIKQTTYVKHEYSSSGLVSYELIALSITRFPLSKPINRLHHANVNLNHL